MDNALRVLHEQVNDNRNAVPFDWEKIWIHLHISRSRRSDDVMKILTAYPGVTLSLGLRKCTTKRSEIFRDMEAIVNEIQEQKAEHQVNFEIPVKFVFTEYGRLYDFL